MIDIQDRLRGINLFNIMDSPKPIPKSRIKRLPINTRPIIYGVDPAQEEMKHGGITVTINTKCKAPSTARFRAKLDKLVKDTIARMERNLARVDSISIGAGGAGGYGGVSGEGCSDLRSRKPARTSRHG